MLAVDAMRMSTSDIVDKNQYGIGRPGGASTATHVTQALLEHTERLCGTAAVPCVLAIDFVNAYGTLNRQTIFDAVAQRPALHLLAGFVAFSLGRGATNLAIGRDTTGGTTSFEIQRGIRQGDPISPWLYCITVDSAITHLTLTTAPKGPIDTITGDTRYLDDNTFTAAAPINEPTDGRPTCVLELLDRLLTDPTFMRTGLRVNLEKSTLWSNTRIPAWLAAAGTSRGIQVREGPLSILGIPIGRLNDTDMQPLTDRYLPGILRQTAIAKHPRLGVQAAWLLLRQSTAHKVGYVARCIPPSIADPLLQQADAAIEACACDILALPQRGSATSHPLARMGLPTSLGGAGLVPATVYAPAAYLAGLAATAPDLARVIPPHHIPSLSAIGHAGACLDTLRAAGLTEDDGLPPTAEACLDPEWAPPRRLQAVLTTAVLRRRWLALLESTADPLEQASIRSHGSQGAAALLHAIPTERALQVPDDAMRAALRMRIGLDPVNNLPHACPHCGAPLAKGAHCLGGCNLITSTLGRTRHNLVMGALTTVLRLHAGVVVTTEPTAQAQGWGQGSQRPDLLLNKIGSIALDGLALDVGVTSPLTQTAIITHRSNVDTLAAATAAEAAKRAKYAGTLQGVRLEPLIFECTGAPGRRALAIMKSVAIAMTEHAQEAGAALPMWRAAQLVQQRLAVALHQGNWVMVRGVIARARGAELSPRPMRWQRRD